MDEGRRVHFSEIEQMGKGEHRITTSVPAAVPGTRG
jgi:hypothetical protein